MKKKLVVLVLIFVIFGLVGCIRSYDSVHSYNDEVVVEYHQTKRTGINDYLKFTFNKGGNYTFYFSPELKDNTSKITFHIENAGEIRLVEQYILPDFLTITYNNESYEFK